LILKAFNGSPLHLSPHGCRIARAGQPFSPELCCSLFHFLRTTAMTTSSSSAASRPQTRSEWVSTLPPWRRLLAMLNWRPVYDIEQRTKQLEIENKRLAALESRLDSLLLNADSSSQTPPATGSN
jgi:hypothetical protein